MSPLFPYRVRAGQDQVLTEVAAVARRGGVLLIDAATGSGKTVATLAPLIEHAEAEDHRILYLVRTHSQEVQVLSEARTIAHRLERPILAMGLEGRQRRCFLLEGLAEMRGATAEEHGKLCADRKRATQHAFEAGAVLTPPEELPEGGSIDLTDLDGCPYYARVLQSDMESLVERFSAKVATPREFDEYCRSENICAYELSKRLVRKARLVTAPYAFFFHPHIRTSLLQWLGVGIDRVDLVVDEAHNIPDHLRELTTVALPQESVRRARAEIYERGDITLAEGPTGSRFFEIVAGVLDEMIDRVGEEDDAILPPRALEDTLLTNVGGTSHRLDTWLGELANWGEGLREERRRSRRLPRSWVHTVALTLLSWPQLESPAYVKVATRRPRRALEAYALDARLTAEPIRECHTSIHLSGTLAPLTEYRDALGLGPETHLLSVPSHFPAENRRIFFEPTLSTRYEELQNDPGLVARIADRLAEFLQALPVKTAVFFPSFELMERVLAAGLHSALPPNAVIETRQASMSDLWRSVEMFKQDPGDGVLLGVTGGRIAEGIDFPNEELEAVVVVGIPFPKPTAKREALRAFWDKETGHGWEYAMEAPAQRQILQALGRMIRSENDRGIAVILDRRAPIFQSVLPGLAEVTDLERESTKFFGRPLRWSRRNRPPPSPGPGPDPAVHNG